MLHLLGSLLTDGRGVKPDLARANGALEKACTLDDDLGCWMLALHHQRGIGVEKDRERARELARKSCELGVVTACRRGLE